MIILKNELIVPALYSIIVDKAANSFITLIWPQQQQKMQDKAPASKAENQAFPIGFQKVMRKAQNLRKTEDLVLVLAPAGGFEPLAFRLGGGRSILLSYAGIYLPELLGHLIITNFPAHVNAARKKSLSFLC